MAKATKKKSASKKKIAKPDQSQIALSVVEKAIGGKLVDDADNARAQRR